MNDREAEDRPYTPRLMSRWLVVVVSLALLTIFLWPYVFIVVMSIRHLASERVDVYRGWTDAAYLADCLENFHEERARAAASFLAWDIIEKAPVETQRRIIRAWIDRGDGGTGNAVVLGFRYTYRAGPASQAMLLDECVRGLLATDADRVRLAGWICRAFSKAPAEQTGFPEIELEVCGPQPLNDRGINEMVVYLIEWRSHVSP
ncbi:MAG: hypothetical protein K2Y21_00755 [Phycisphaerales bacterium]|nr:hypothetical protein [Phycisphaerales bacterium]